MQLLGYFNPKTCVCLVTLIFNCMAQILITIEDNSLVFPLLSVIEKLKGVTHASLYKKKTSSRCKKRKQLQGKNALCGFKGCEEQLVA